MSELAASVAIPTRDRPLRLRWLLNALLVQTLAPQRFEVIVAHDSTEPDTERLLQTHPLVARGQLRVVRFAPGSMLAAAKRNAAWRAAGAPRVLFTDDDCRPAPDWVERALGAADAHPGAIVQGRTVPDPDELATLIGAPWPHTQLIEPVSAWAETCNIAYPRAVLEKTGGFDEQLGVGEDTDLALRAGCSGVAIVAAPELLVYHAVVERSLPTAIRSLRRWEDVPLLVRRQPSLRGELWGRIWWKREHAALAAAGLGATLARRRRGAAALALPWLALAIGHRGYGPRGLARAASELPGRAAIDGAELAVMVRGSIRHRTLVL